MSKFMAMIKKLFHRHSFECYEGYGQTKHGVGTYKYFICECGKTSGDIFDFKLDEEMYAQKEETFYQ